MLSVMLSVSSTKLHLWNFGLLRVERKDGTRTYEPVLVRVPISETQNQGVAKKWSHAAESKDW